MIKKMKKIFIALIFLPAVVSASEFCADKDVCTTTVTKVIDGDTVTIQSGEKVRYVGIDCPERGDNYSKEAKKRNEELVKGKEVVLKKDQTDKDKYDRLLRYVYIDNNLINQILINEGLARVYILPPDDSQEENFTNAQKEAKDKMLGIWQDKDILLEECKTEKGEIEKELAECKTKPVNLPWNAIIVFLTGILTGIAVKLAISKKFKF